MRFESTIKAIISRTADVKSFRFPRPMDFSYKAGQFIMVTIRSGDYTLTKPFSISSSPTEQDYLEFTKKLTGHEFSTTLEALKVGDWAMIEGPYGSFTFQGEYRKLCLLSGGVGITPLRSICKYVTDTNLDVSIIVIYGCRSEENIIFREDLEQLPRQNKNSKVVFTLDEPDSGWSGEIGVINANMIQRNVPDYLERVFYTCGPPGMVQAMTALLKSLVVPSENIRIENFAGY